MPVQRIGAGSQTSIAALYENYFKQLNSILDHLDLAELSVKILSRLSIQKLRYMLWGESVGLVHRDSQAEQLPNPTLGDSIQQFKLSRILMDSLLNLAGLRGIGLDYSSLQIRKPPEQVPQPLKIFDRTFEQFTERLMTQSQDDPIPGPKWIIYDPEVFTATIVQQMGELLDELEKGTAAIEPTKVRHTRIKAEIMSISTFENLRLIRDATIGWYPFFHESAVDRLASITDVTEEMFPLTWTDSIATTMQGQSVHASDYSITNPTTSTFRNNLLRRLAVARSAVPTFRLGRPGRKLEAQIEDTAEEENVVNPKNTVEVERHKIVVLGDQCVGKTALVIMFCRQNIYSFASGDPTIEDSYSKDAVIDERRCILEILDTSGDEVYATLREGWISSGDAFMLVYSIHDRFSFETARKNRLLVWGKAAMIVGSRYTDETKAVPRKRVVSTAEGLALAKELNCGFIEVSARDEKLVEEAFDDVVRELRKRAAKVRE